jgi:hypothetical protein
MNKARIDKREANRAYYLKAKARREAALLRFEVGDLARLDHACSAAGLSRSAFAKLYLLPLADAIAARIVEIEASRQARAISLSSFLDRAIANALGADPGSPSAPSTAADEFDALFGSGASDGSD